MYIGVWPEYHVAKLVAKAHAKHSKLPSQHQPMESASQSGDSWRSSTSASTTTSWISEVREGMGQAQFAKRVDIFKGHEPSPRLRSFNIGPDQLPAACRSQSERRLVAQKARLPSLQQSRGRISSSSPQQRGQRERQRPRSQPRLSQPSSSVQEDKRPQERSTTNQNFLQAVTDRSSAQGGGRPPQWSRPCSRPRLRTSSAHTAHSTTDGSACTSLPAIRDAAQPGSCSLRTHLGEPSSLSKPSDMAEEASMPSPQQVFEISHLGSNRSRPSTIPATESLSELEGFRQEKERLQSLQTVRSQLHGIRADTMIPEPSATPDRLAAGAHPEALHHHEAFAQPSDTPVTTPSQDECAAFVLDPATEELIAWSQGLQLEDSFGSR